MWLMSIIWGFITHVNGNTVYVLNISRLKRKWKSQNFFITASINAYKYTDYITHAFASWYTCFNICVHLCIILEWSRINTSFIATCWHMQDLTYIDFFFFSLCLRNIKEEAQTYKLQIDQRITSAGLKIRRKTKQ